MIDNQQIENRIAMAEFILRKEKCRSEAVEANILSAAGMILENISEGLTVPKDLIQRCKILCQEF